MPTETAAAAWRKKAAFNQRLTTLSPSAEESAAFLDLKADSRTIRARQEIISEGRRCTSVFLISEGMAMRYRILRDGQRQILNLILPGDFAGVTNCFFESALYSIRTLTNAVVSPIPLARLMALFDTHPGFAAKVLRLLARDAAMCAEHLIGVGRRSAPERLAHFLLEMLTRLQAKGLASERSYRLPLTQEMISDALGLSIPYVNRILHQLRDDGLVRIDNQMVVIEKMEELSVLADFELNYLMPLSVSELQGQAGLG